MALGGVADVPEPAHGVQTLGDFMQNLHVGRAELVQRAIVDREERLRKWVPALESMAERQMVLEDELKELRKVLTCRASSIARARKAIQTLLGEAGLSRKATAAGRGEGGIDSDLACNSVSDEGPPPLVIEPVLQSGLTSPRSLADEDRLGAMMRRLENVPSTFRGATSAKLGSQIVRTDTLNSKVEAPRPFQFHDYFLGRVFEKVCLTVILFQAIMMGVALQINSYASTESQDFFETADTVCLSWYVIEVVLKLCFLRRDFFCGPDVRWNFFDVVCLVPVPSIVDSLTSDAGDEDKSSGNVAFIRSLRMFKMVKMLRVIRLMRFFRELRLLLNTLVGTVTTLFWSLVMLVLMMYGFAIFIMQAIQTYLLDLDEGRIGEIDLHDDLLTYWGSIGSSLLTLFMSLTGGLDWITVADPLLQASVFSYMMFHIYIAMLQLAILNVMVGIFCDCAQTIAGNDMASVIAETEAKNRFSDQLATALFEEMDKDRTGVITRAAWEQHYDSPRVQKYFDVFELNQSNAWQLFNALGGEDGEVDVQEFLAGCKQVRGDCHRRQIQQVMGHARCGARMFTCLMTYVEDAFRELFPRLVRGKISGKAERTLPVWSLREQLKQAKVPMHKEGGHYK